MSQRKVLRSSTNWAASHQVWGCVSGNTAVYWRINSQNKHNIYFKSAHIKYFQCEYRNYRLLWTKLTSVEHFIETTWKLSRQSWITETRKNHTQHHYKSLIVIKTHYNLTVERRVTKQENRQCFCRGAQIFTTIVITWHTDKLFKFYLPWLFRG